jgi:hypothetical protein
MHRFGMRLAPSAAVCRAGDYRRVGRQLPIMRAKKSMDQIFVDILRRYLRDSETSWSCGSFGAIAEFARDPGEDAEISEDGFHIVTARGGIQLTPVDDIRPVAFELPGHHPYTWQHGLALCLPAEYSRLAGREALTELGPDTKALRPGDRKAILFDLGFAIGHADICVRTANPETIGLLRGGLGRSLLSPEGFSLLREIARLSPHRVFRCRFGRVEVYQPIPSPKDQSPPGPHTHVLPRLLALRRSHAATLPIPAGCVPCMMMYPPNPISDGHGGVRSFDNEVYEVFQRLWKRYGVQELVALKEQIFAVLSAGQFTSPRDLPPLDRAGRALIRVALRQWQQIRSPVEQEWIKHPISELQGSVNCTDRPLLG